ncbi:MAG: type II secretion system F family protein [Acidimicrobiales bacterium]
MTGLALALAAGYGVYLLYTSVTLGWRGLGLGPSVTGAPSWGRRMEDRLHRAGLGDVAPLELAGAVGVLAAVGALSGWVLFGGALPPLVAGTFAATFPVAAARAGRERRRAEARDAWPRLIEEIRIQVVTLGRSIPQAVLEVGRRAPAEMGAPFEAARREWLISTDFERTLAVLRRRLADPTADTVCETLLVAHEIGGAQVDRCLVALAEDRIMDLQGRKDARARQAGAAFARSFVLVVPLGMALIGLSIGEGRAAYQTASAQVLVLVGLAMVGLCWAWAGRIMRLPDQQRVFDTAPQPGGRPR